MASKGPPSFDLPEPLLSALPSDPFDQLDVARKITSIALASRVSVLESEADQLRSLLADKDSLLADLREQLDDLNASLTDSDRQLALAHEEKETLVKENTALSNTVKKLNRDVSKLEVFKKTLMQSLQEEDENSQAGAPRVVPKSIAKATNFSTGSLLEEDSTPPPAKSSSVQTQFSETGSSILEDGGYSETNASRQNVPFSLPLKSQGGTPRLTPPDSPMISAGGSPTRLSKPASPRRHSISFSTTRPSMYSSLPTSHNTMTSPFDTGVQTGRARVDGKEFFRQVRSRLSYEQFSAFLANVKELNAHKQTREETLQKADDIFGPDNKDLYTIFEGLITRNIH